MVLIVNQETVEETQHGLIADLSDTISMRKSEPEPIRVVKEKAYRSLLKSFSWRITATMTTIAIAYLIIGDITSALEIGGAEFIIKMVVYFFHERMWSHLKVGQIVEERPPMDFQI